MFTGEYSHSMDAKGRIIIPAKLREELGEVCYVMRGEDKCLNLVTPETFQELSDRLKEMSKDSPRQARTLSRVFFASAGTLEFDKQGRVTIPAHLREYAEIGKDAIVAGTNDRVEIWNREEWDKANAEALQVLDELGDGSFGFLF